MAEKNPILAAIASLLICGLGQIYNGQTTKGLSFLLLYIVLWVVAGLLTVVGIGLCLFPVPIILLIYAVYDAYVTAEKINRGEGA